MSSAIALPRRSLLPRALRAAGRQISLLTACLALAGVAPLAAQNPGDRDVNFTSAAVGATVYTQYVQYLNGVPYVLVGGDAAALLFVNAADGSFAELADLPRFGNQLGRIVYTAVPEQILQTGSTNPYILVGGLFGRNSLQNQQNQAAQNLKRLTPLGVEDTTFNANGRGANDYVTSIVALPNGDIVIGGAFDAYNGQQRVRLARLDNTGALVDGSVFDPNLTFDAQVLTVVAQTTGAGTVANPQFVVGGQFSNVNGVQHNKLVRINNDGTVDGNFNPSFDARVTAITMQPDGRILVGGDFTTVNGTAASRIVRLNDDGSVDPTFTAVVTGQPFGFETPPAVYTIRLLDNGSMYLGGNFTTVDGVARQFIAKVDANGALDTGFDPGGFVINAVQSIVVQPDGKLLIGETRTRRNGAKVYPASQIRLYGEPVTVNLTASKPTAVESTGQKGVFTLTRSGSSLNEGPLTVYLQFDPNDSARAPLNYEPLKLTVYRPASNIYSVTFQPGQTSIKIKVKPSGRIITQANSRTVRLTLLGDQTGTASYSFNGDTQTVTIRNN